MKGNPVNLKAVDKPFNDEDTLARIGRYIENPPENSRIFTITPKVAATLLENYNKENRSKKPAAIAEYAGDMAAGNWFVTGDTLKFSDKQRLRDGQNRLSACVRAGKPFKTHLVFGIDDGAFYAMDQGKNRGGSDVLHIAGYANTTVLAAAVRWAWLIDEDRVKQRDTLKPDETLHLLQERYKTLRDFIPPASAIYRLTGQPIGLVAAMLYCFDKANSVVADKFTQVWSSGDYKSGQRAVFGKLQKEIARLQAASSGRVHDVVRAAMIVRAWNAFAERRVGRASDFRWTPTTDDFPAISKG